MSERDLKIPKHTEDTKNEEIMEEVKENETQKLSKEEADYIEKVFFEEDETVFLRDGKSYKIPPLALKDARRLLKKLQSIDTGVILVNLLQDKDGNDTYEELLDVLLMAFKPYYKEVTVEYLEEYVDIELAKKIIDIMIGLNGIKKSL